MYLGLCMARTIRHGRSISPSHTDVGVSGARHRWEMPSHGLSLSTHRRDSGDPGMRMGRDLSHGPSLSHMGGTRVCLVLDMQ